MKLDRWQPTSVGALIDPDRPITYGVVQPGDHDPNGIPLVRGGDFSFGWKSLGDYRRVSPDVERPFSRARLKPGDIVITIKGDVGASAIVPDFLEGANLSQTNARIAIHPDRAEPEIVLAFLRSHEGRKQIHAVTQTGAQPGLIFRDIQALRFRLPPLPEQQQIAEILRTWDEAIDAASRLIAAKRRRLDSLTVGLVFGTLRLPEFETGGDRTQGRWFDVPAGWSITRVGKVARESSRRNADGNVSEVLSCSKYDGFVRSLEYFKKQVYSADLTTYKIIARGEFGFPSNHIEEGSIGLQDLEDLAVVSPIYTIFCFDDARVDNRFAIRVLKTSLYRHIFEVSTSSSVDRRGSLRWSEFSRLPFPLPPLEEQQAVAAILNRQAYEIDTESARLDALQRQKRGLMQKLLTGEWRVNPPPSSP